MDELVSDSLADRRLQLTLLGLLAGAALTLAAVGVSGMIACDVAQRTREIGLRLAIGASPGSVMLALLEDSGALAASGVTIGICGALMVTRFIASFLYGVEPTDMATLGATAAILMSCAMLASYFPARRALRVDPVVALRAD